MAAVGALGPVSPLTSLGAECTGTSTPTSSQVMMMSDQVGGGGEHRDGRCMSSTHPSTCPAVSLLTSFLGVGVSPQTQTSKYGTGWETLEDKGSQGVGDKSHTKENLALVPGTCASIPGPTHNSARARQAFGAGEGMDKAGPG